MKKILLSLAACLAFGVSANAELVTDVLTPASIGLDGTSGYKDYTYKGASGAEYALQCSNGTEIQLRATNPSGIVVTKSAGKVTKVEVVWNGSTVTGTRTLNVYGSETAYTAPADLYNADANKLGGITCGSQTEFTLTTPAPYIGLRSDNGAMYLTSISITWDADGSAGGETPEQPDPDQPDPDQPENPDSEAGEFTIVWADQGYANGTALENFTKDGITYAFSKGSNNNSAPAYYSTGTAIRLYGGNTMTLSVGTGYLISKVEFTVGGSNPFNVASTASVGTLDVENAVWTSTEGAQSVTFTQGGTSGHVRIEKMVITVIAGEGGETPEEPDPDQPGEPTEVWTVAKALEEIGGGFEGEARVKGYISQIDEISTSYGNATYYIVDKMGDAASLEVFRGYSLDGQKFTAEDEIEVGGLVVVEGQLKNYNGTFEFTTGSKIISYEAPAEKPEEPTGENVTFDFTKPSTLDAELSDEGEANEEVQLTNLSFTSEVITISFESLETASTQPRLFYGSGGSAGWTFRFYKDNTFTVTADEGYNLTAIEFNGTNLTGLTISNGTLVSGKWTPEGNVSTVSFSKEASGNNPTVKTMTVYYEKATTDAVDTIEAAEAGETVYYNLQGVRVANPERGIFIKVTGKKAEKVVL